MKTNLLKSSYLLFALWLSCIYAGAQTYLFEQDTAPAEWTPVQGTLAISSVYFKEGTRSLSWTTTGASVLQVSTTPFTASSGNSAFLQIYTPFITNDTLVIEFLSQNVVRRTANFLLNYKGWREFNRAYNEYVSNVSFSVTSLKMTLKPTNPTAARTLYFDDVRLNQSTASTRITGSQWILDKQFFTSNNDQLKLFANPTDFALTTPTSKELADLQQVRAAYQPVPTAGTFANLISAKNYVTALNIIRQQDGTVSGVVINTSASAMTTAVVTDHVVRLEVLAAEGLKDAATLTIFRNYLDHLLLQGFAEGANFLIKSNDYTASRNIPSRILNILPACTSEQRAEVLKLARWVSYYGMIYEPESSYLANLNSDVIYLYLPYMIMIASQEEDNAVAVREMKAVQRFINRNTEYSPGGNDILKPDGTGFHHGTHYNNYMYSYQTWANAIIALAGTSYSMSPEAYQRFRKAVITKYIMATKDLNNTRHTSNTFAGRNPFGPGIQVYFSRSLMEQLIVAGGAILGTSMDEELAAAYNYFFDTEKYAVATKSYDGFHQFNYSPAAIYRRGNWVASMRAPTTQFWGTEIYSGENRLGRYQSHGTLDITYRGTPATSGYPGSDNGGGWDWNVIPGTTTVHYTSWFDMMPNKNTTDRFDQYTKTKNFSGALSWNDCGIFASDFDQGDTWGSQRFVPTNLVFKKSMYAFDNLIISLGSNISSSGTYSNAMVTATNLFQNLISSQSKALIVNGEEKQAPFTTSLSGAQRHWIMSPQGTGYFIPQGNDDIQVVYGTQKTPYQNGSDAASPVTTVTAAKAYLTHGVKPSGKSYSFVVLPATTSEAMQQFSSAMASPVTAPYTVLSQTSTLHALWYKPSNIYAYTFFGATFNLTTGIVKSSTAEHLLMHRPEESSGLQHFAASNANLKPVNDALYGWRATTSQTTLTLAGNWYLLKEVEGVKIYPPDADQTQLTLTFSQGEPLYFTLKPEGYTGLTNPEQKEWIRIFSKKDGLKLELTDPTVDEITFQLVSMDGKMLHQQVLTNSKEFELPFYNLKQGVYIARMMTRDGRSFSHKWINI